MSLGRLLRPRSVVFVGGAIAAAARDECEAAGFDGPVYAVHPRGELGGRPAYRNVAELPEAPDAAFVAVNAATTVEIVRELAAIGAGGAACYAAGFSEAGTEAGAALEEALREAAGAMPVLGPNCYGAIDLVGGAGLWPVPWPHERRERGVAVVLQSGNLGINVTMNQRSLPLAFVASIGNQAVVELAEVVDAYLDLDEVTGIGIYLEGLRDVPRFAAAAARALERSVPLAVCKAGVSALGRELARTHTASLAGSDALYDALCRRYGIARVRTIPELLETLKALVSVGPLAGRRLFVFTCSGAESALVADLAEGSGLELPQPAPATRERLAGALPEFALVSNPLDYNSALWGLEEPLHRVFSTALADPADAALLVIDHPRPGMAYSADVDRAIAAHLRACAEAGVPAAVASVLPESLRAHAREELLGRGAAPLQGLAEAFVALGACARLGERLRAGRPAALAPVAALAGGGRLRDEAESKALAAAFGLAVPVGRLVSPPEAPAAAAALGFPVAAKLCSPELPHKAAARAVSLGLRDEAEVTAAVEAMRRANPGLLLSGVLVEQMVAGAVCELLLGALHDPAFGHVLLVGSGGGLVELVADARALLLPVAREDVEAALASLRVGPLLRRGDLAAAVDAALALVRLVEAHADRLVEVDVNPLLVLERGAVAVDVLARL
ncbi:MAG: acetate--CoA ligase family protein [Thermoleophilia bacterium]|nr:acetate--CoA ligase family protein [Thermoleophilia bacterium]